MTGIVLPGRSYIDILRQSYTQAGNNVCLGIDPQWQALPPEHRRTLRGCAPDCHAVQEFLQISLQSLCEQGLSPGAFKPNLGYFQVLDRPLWALQDDRRLRSLAFGGSRLLAWLLHYLSENFPGIPVILDFKKGDIARSSANYAEEGFLIWRCDALTVNPYMGADSIMPFGRELESHLRNNNPEALEDSESLSCGLALARGNGGVYSLLRTSNPGRRDLQDLRLDVGGPADCAAGDTGQRLYHNLAATLLRWRSKLDIPGLGAVVGATSLKELRDLAIFFSLEDFPLLIPGVGKQGGDFHEVKQCLCAAGYPLELARINVSSGLLQSWLPKDAPKDSSKAPTDWYKLIGENLSKLL